MNLNQFNWVLKKGLDINQMICLLLLSQGESFENPHIKVVGWLNILEKNQLILNKKLTEKGDIYIAEYLTIPSIEPPETSFNLEVWVSQLHEKLKGKLKELTGASQKRAKIRTQSYSFLCNEKDLLTKIKSFLKTYKTNNYTKIEKTLLNHINICHKSDSWFPLIEYYIMKDGTSKLATDMDSIEEITLEEKITAIDTKELF